MRWRASRIGAEAAWREPGVAGSPGARGTRRRAAASRPPRLRRWAVAGAAAGSLLALPAFAPAAWLAQAVARASDGRLLLADARGTLWSGDAVLALTAGAGARDAAALPGRLEWTLGWRAGAFELVLRHACCVHGTPTLRVQPALAGLTIALAADPGEDGRIGRWPADWLTGLGTPWNTLQLSGELRLDGRQMSLQRRDGAWQADGALRLVLHGVASRLSTLPLLGSWHLDLAPGQDAPESRSGVAPSQVVSTPTGEAADLSRTRQGTLALTLATDQGPLRLEGRGHWSERGLQLRGQASADPGSEAALAPLLDIIGRRQGDRSLIAIG